MQLGVEKRYSPRVTTNSSIKLFPGNIECNLLNISETGVCFECEGDGLPGSISLSTDILSPNSKKPSEITAKIVRKTTLPNNRLQVGAQFASSAAKYLPQARDYVFDNFAEKAVATIKEENKDIKTKVEDFFKKDVRKFHEEISEFVQDVDKGKVESRDVEKKITALINDLLIKGDALEATVNNKIAFKKIKQIFRDLTGCWYYKSPILKMAYDKPRGYPGDYKLFEIIYDKKPLAEDGTLGFHWDNYFLNNGYAQAARARKNKMKNILQDLIENSDLETVRMLNVACGPSREIRELLSIPDLPSRKKLIFTGLDNDEESLKFSESKFKNLPANMQVRLLNENVLNIFRDKKYYDLIGKQDIIYILGLTEYLPDRIFRKLTSFLFTLLNDKGMLVITYKDEAITFPSLPPEWLCDWAFIKRDKDDLVNTAKELGSNKCSLKIEREGTGYIYFLILTKN
jgi:hypothetical protein